MTLVLGLKDAVQFGAFLHKELITQNLLMSSKSQKCCFRSVPPGGLKLGRIAVNFGFLREFIKVYLYTKFEVPSPSRYQTCHLSQTGQTDRQTDRRPYYTIIPI